MYRKLFVVVLSGLLFFIVYNKINIINILFKTGIMIIFYKICLKVVSTQKLTDCIPSHIQFFLQITDALHFLFVNKQQ